MVNVITDIDVSDPVPIIAGRSRRRVQVDTSDLPSLTQQQFKDDTDINLILDKYMRSGVLSHVNDFQSYFADVSELCDYQSSLNVVLRAHEAFLALPSKTRARFENDPAKLLAFVSDPSNLEEMYALGLAVKPADAPPATVSDGGAAAGGMVAPSSTPPAASP